uniref:40S ribosomal protein S3 n=1 Tax=Solanum tuberosum TaxID=4113 RepID=M1BEZ3_SOLTU
MTVSGKLITPCANSMKFKDGYMISSGQPVNVYTDSAATNVLLRQGVLGIKIEKPCLIGIQKNAQSNNTSFRSCHDPFSQGRRRVHQTTCGAKPPTNIEVPVQ